MTTHTHVHVRKHNHTQARMKEFLDTHPEFRTYVYTNIYHTYTHTHTHTHAQTNTHIYIYISLDRSWTLGLGSLLECRT